MDSLAAPELYPDTNFSDRKSRRARSWRFFLSLLLLAGYALFGYFAWLWFAPRVAKFGLPILWINGKTLLILLPCLLLGLFYLFFANFPRKKTIIALTSDGIRKIVGGKSQVMRWDSLEKLRIKFSQARFLGFPGRRREHVELIDAADNLMRIDRRIDHFHELVNLVRERSFSALLNLAQRQLSERGKVYFGRFVSLDRDAIQLRKVSLPRSEISLARVEKGWLKIKTQPKKQYKLRADQLDNLDVLLYLLSNPN